jgi:2-keto-4-pentenoate hydratase
VRARLAATAIPAFPCEIPTDLAASYACQDLAIDMWPDQVRGWKIGRINPPLDARLGADRLAGPIFARSIVMAEIKRPTPFPVIADGFAAVEAEFVFQVGQDAPRDKREWSRDEAAALVSEVFIGVEIAGSPLATINELGPLVVASDFGNNTGLILGPKAEGWRGRPFDAWTCETFIEGRSVGRGAVSDLPGGPFEAMRFIVELCAARRRPLAAGDFISTGAVTGVHDILAGQSARLRFAGFGELECTAVAATPLG